MYGISTIAFFCGIIQHYAVAKGGIFMGEQKPEKKKKHICAGLLAHVDAGKTTLSEGILYQTGTPMRWNGQGELRYFPNRRS